MWNFITIQVGQQKFGFFEETASFVKMFFNNVFQLKLDCTSQVIFASSDNFKYVDWSYNCL